VCVREIVGSEHPSVPTPFHSLRMQIRFYCVCKFAGHSEAPFKIISVANWCVSEVREGKREFGARTRERRSSEHAVCVCVCVFVCVCCHILISPVRF